MRIGIALALALVLLGGCARRATVVGPCPRRPIRANLALGPTAEHTQLAQLYTRSDWPAIENGLRAEDVTYYSTMTYDEQYHYDRHGGLYRGAESVQMGVYLR
jgi:hypothetical protein